FSIILSMLLIIISLIEWGVASGAKSEALFRNAELLNEHERKISLFKNCLKEEIMDDDYKYIDNLRDEYEKIKSTCTFNHSPVDYEYHKIVKSRYYIAHTSESFSFWRVLKGRVNYSISSIWGYLIIWSIVAIFFFKVLKVIASLY
ncbi:TPA: SLATT domain-containing protein, partial [Klebsiella pneumoniae]|nr:SLATT domain-containing protein [Klebsiella pneumoniae]